MIISTCFFADLLLRNLKTHNNHSEELLLTYDESSDDMDFDVLVIQRGEVQMLVDIDTISHQKWNPKNK